MSLQQKETPPCGDVGPAIRSLGGLTSIILDNHSRGRLLRVREKRAAPCLRQALIRTRPPVPLCRLRRRTRIPKRNHPPHGRRRDDPHANSSGIGRGYQLRLDLRACGWGGLSEPPLATPKRKYRHSGESRNPLGKTGQPIPIRGTCPITGKRQKVRQPNDVTPHHSDCATQSHNPRQARYPNQRRHR